MKISLLLTGLLFSTPTFADITLKCSKVFGKGPFESFMLKLPHAVGEELDGDTVELEVAGTSLSSTIATEYGWSFNLNFNHDDVTTTRMHVGWDDDGVSAYVEHVNEAVAYNSFYRCEDYVAPMVPTLPSASTIKSAFDDFTFQMEVEGAALDPELTSKAFEKLESRLHSFKADGMSYQDLVLAAAEYIRDPMVRAEVKQALRMIDLAHLSLDEMNVIIRNILKMSYRKEFI